MWSTGYVRKDLNYPPTAFTPVGGISEFSHTRYSRGGSSRHYGLRDRQLRRRYLLLTNGKTKGICGKCATPNPDVTDNTAHSERHKHCSLNRQIDLSIIVRMKFTLRAVPTDATIH